MNKKSPELVQLKNNIYYQPTCYQLAHYYHTSILDVSLPSRSIATKFYFYNLFLNELLFSSFMYRFQCCYKNGQRLDSNPSLVLETTAVTTIVPQTLSQQVQLVPKRLLVDDSLSSQVLRRNLPHRKYLFVSLQIKLICLQRLEYKDVHAFVCQNFFLGQ